MTETQRRIRAYQKALPELRDRVIAVALLLVMSASMLTSASFAWLTISRRPEVSGVSTTVAANGNLEIALATSATAPGDSKVGDSSAAEGQSITGSNVTWGNLVNLSDPSYGLENLALRPAQLNTAALLTSPLYGAIYDPDGRIKQLNSSFGYAMWVPAEGDKPGYFDADVNGYGVRAIASTTIEAVGADITYTKMVTAAKDTNLAAANMYVSLGNNDKYMPSLATMMGLYMTARMNPDHATLSNPDCAVADIQNLRDMYAAFLLAFDKEAEAMAALVNLQLFLRKGDGNYTPYTADMIYATTTAKLKAEGIQITNLDQFIKDRNIIVSDLAKLTEICESGTTLKWKDSGLNGVVNNLVNVGACTIGADNTPISSIGASNAMGYLSGTQEARITNGILYRFEERTGGYISVKNLGISATVNRLGMTIPATVKANIQTTAPRDYNLFNNDLLYAQSLNTGNYQGGVPVAEDTYGLAIDLWVRTNAEGSHLTLEGNVLTETSYENATTKDADGNTVDVYTVTRSVEDGEGGTISVDVDLYKKEADDGTVTWYDADTHTPLTAEDLGDSTPTQKVLEIHTVTGFEGENRVWDNAMMSVDATTQGSGSCYVYYADTPEDQARSLELLKSMHVAFVGSDGKLMAEAEMDTERFFADSGRVIVPLILQGDSLNLGEDYEGNVTYAITPLEKNVPTRITAIVYLDGTKLNNEDVLSAADIQGQLNIQFGSSMTMQPIENEPLQNATRSVSAAVDKTSFDYDTATGPMTTNVTVHVDGEQPNTVTAFFLRQINATQGSREEVMTFTKTSETDWTSSYTFEVPGTYVLRTVQLDGVDYDLPAGTSPKVTVTGFALESLSCTQAQNNHLSVLTAANSTSVDLSLKFATDNESKMPRSVQGRYLNDADGSAITVEFTKDSTTQIWSGSATFRDSGNYTMEYLVLDGEYHYLQEGFIQTATVTLGMRVAIYTTSPHTFKYVPSEMADNEKLLGMQVMVMDNTGKEMPGLSDVKLTYGMKGSGIKKMDTDLTWNGSFYVGELTTTGPGIWQFSNVVVGKNTLTNATTYPTFTIQSPEPPEYYDHSTMAYQYSPNSNAVMNAQITNSAAATVQGYIVKQGSTEGVWVDGVIGGELTTSDGKSANHWSFAVPKDANGYQDGNWTLKELKLWDVFAADGTAYTEDAPLVIDISDANNVTKAVSRLNITFAQDKSTDFGKDASGKVVGNFMQSYTISGLNVDIRDFEGNVQTRISDVQLKFSLENNTSPAYGGYKNDNATEFTVSLGDDGSGTHFVQREDVTIIYAGKYTTEFSFKVNGTLATYSGDNLPPNAPKFTVSSITPTVKITSAEYANKSGGTSSFTDIATTVYYKEGTESSCGITYYNYTPAKVDITLSGYGNAAGAKLEFTTSNPDGKVHLYEYSQRDDGTSTNAYSWTGNGVCTRYMGFWESKTGSDEKISAGTLTATELVLTYGGKEYSVDVPDFTIKNPS